jgi:hypothetical protein
MFADVINSGQDIVGWAFTLIELLMVEKAKQAIPVWPERARSKAPEDWRTPRRCAQFASHSQTLCVLDYGGPPPL